MAASLLPALFRYIRACSRGNSSQSSEPFVGRTFFSRHVCTAGTLGTTYLFVCSTRKCTNHHICECSIDARPSWLERTAADGQTFKVQTLLKGHAEAACKNISCWSQWGGQFLHNDNYLVESCCKWLLQSGNISKRQYCKLLKCPTFHFVKHLVSCHNVLLLLLTSPNTKNISQ